MIQKQYLCDATCMECKEAIFNPICPHCLSEEILSWIETKEDSRLKQKVKKKLEEVIKLSKTSSGKLTMCITCNARTAFLCPYCFTELVYEKLKEMRLKKALIMEFLQIFNYDFEHTGYSREIYGEV